MAARHSWRDRWKRFRTAPLDEIEARQIANLLGEVWAYGPMIVALVALGAFFAREHAPPALVLGFLALLVVEAFLKLWLTHRFTVSSPAGQRASRWRVFVCGGGLWAGVVYGLGALVLLRPMPPEDLFGLVVVYGALLSFAVWGAPHYRPSNRLFATFLALPPGLALMARGDGASFTLGVLLLGAVAIGLRVSERTGESMLRLIELNLENEALRVRAEEAVIAKSRFVAAASHDLRQPLHALGLFQHALGARCTNPDDARLIDSIGQSNAQLGTLLDSLLDVSRLDARAIEPALADVPLAPLFDTLGEEFASLAREKGLTLVRTRPELTVRTDPALLTRVLRNLLSNAVKFTESGSITLDHAIVDGRAIIGVHDTGPGIAEPEREAVFAEFYQGEHARTGARSGVGLGLSIVGRLCELLELPLTLSSPSGDGTRFELAVPLGRRRDAPIPAESAPARRFEGLRVLVVDDDPAILAGMRRTLDGWGCETITAPTTEAALAAVREGRRPDLVLCDYGLRDGIDGIEALERIRRLLGTPIPAALVSGESSPERLQALRGSGIVCLVKPVPPERLRRAIAELVRPPEPPPPPLAHRPVVGTGGLA